jgi:hypothetical protein
MRLHTAILLIALCAQGLAQVTMPGSSVTGAGGVAQSGIYTLLGSAGQTGPPGSSSSGTYLFTGGFLSWSGYSAVSIQHTAPTSATAGTQIQVSSSFQGGSSLTTMALLYRRGGDPAFQSVAMTVTNQDGQATIPGDAVTARGVEYIISASDPASGTQGRMPVSGYYSVQVLTGDPGVRIPAALPAEKYRLVSLPVIAQNPAASSLLTGAFGAYDNTKWRFFELMADQSYSEYPSVSSMSPGKAFWLITKSGGSFSTGQAWSNPTDIQYAVPLNPGWTFVGNPYVFTVPLSKVSRKSLATLDVRRYADTWQVESGGLDPFLGYAVANGNTAIDTLFLNPDLSTGSLPKPAEPPASNQVSWSIGISAQSVIAADADNKALVSATAAKSLDDLDRPEAPPIGDYVSLYFSHPEWHAVFSRYCTDARPVPIDGETWEFAVSSNLRRSVDLRFSGLETVPEAFEVWVVDLSSKTATDIRSSAHHQCVSEGDSQSRLFSLIVGNSAYSKERLRSTGAVPQQYELLQNYPNPFNPTTVIRYALPSSSRVVLEVFDLLGRKVVTLLDEIQPEGFKTKEFDGAGHASGVYIYRLAASPLAGGAHFAQVRKMTLVK